MTEASETWAPRSSLPEIEGRTRRDLLYPLGGSDGSLEQPQRHCEEGEEEDSSLRLGGGEELLACWRFEDRAGTASVELVLVPLDTHVQVYPIEHY